MHHSLIDGSLQVVVNILVQNNVHLSLLAKPLRLAALLSQRLTAACMVPVLSALLNLVANLAVLNVPSSSSSSSSEPPNFSTATGDAKTSNSNSGCGIDGGCDGGSNDSRGGGVDVAAVYDMAWLPLACLLPLPLLAFFVPPSVPPLFSLSSATSSRQQRQRKHGSYSWVYFWLAYGSLLFLGASGKLAWAGKAGLLKQQNSCSAMNGHPFSCATDTAAATSSASSSLGRFSYPVSGNTNDTTTAHSANATRMMSGGGGTMDISGSEIGSGGFGVDGDDSADADADGGLGGGVDGGGFLGLMAAWVVVGLRGLLKWCQWWASISSSDGASGSDGLSWVPSSRHVFSRFVHNLLVTWLLCEAHSGYDLPWMTHRNPLAFLFSGSTSSVHGAPPPPLVVGGAPAHNTHHNRGDVHFQQFFTYLDQVRTRGRDC